MAYTKQHLQYNAIHVSIWRYRWWQKRAVAVKVKILLFLSRKDKLKIIPTLKPCPFGLIKRLDPVVVIFFKKRQKNYKCWINSISKKFTTTGSANTCNFSWKWKNFDFKKNYNYGIKAQLKSHTCNFFEINFFSFPKKNYKCWLFQSL